MKKIVLLVLALAFVAAVSVSYAADAQKVTGYVNDAKCAAKAGADHGDCAKKCIEKGEKAVLVTDGDHKVLAIENQDSIKGHEGHHVTVTGTVKGDSIHVDKVEMVAASK